MTRFLARYGLAMCLVLTAGACWHVRQVRRWVMPRVHRQTAKLLPSAELLEWTAVDSGCCPLFEFADYRNDRRFTHRWSTRYVYVRVRELGLLPVGQACPIPADRVGVAAWSKGPNHFRQLTGIAGTITRVASRKRGERLKLVLTYVDDKGSVQPLVRQTVTFRWAPADRRLRPPAYQGRYPSLRAALRAPAKVRVLTQPGDYVGRLPPEERDSVVRRVGELVHVEQLCLCGLLLDSVPAGVGQLRRLRKLGLGGNHLRQLPAVVLQLDSLEELNLDGNKLTHLPATIGKLQRLRKLDLSRNFLDGFPSAVQSLPGLRVLVLDNDNIWTIPPGISQLTGLDSLSLRGGQIEDLTPLSTLTRLRYLNVANNQIRQIPEAFYQLQALEELHLRGNPLDTATLDRRRMPKLRVVR